MAGDGDLPGAGASKRSPSTVPSRFTHGITVAGLYDFLVRNHSTIPACPGRGTALPFVMLTTRQVVERVVAPAIRPGYSYCDMLLHSGRTGPPPPQGEQNLDSASTEQQQLPLAGKAATVYVVHAWDGPFSVLAETLLLRFNTAESRADTVLWIDVFSLPQSDPAPGTPAAAGPQRFVPKMVPLLMASSAQRCVCLVHPWLAPLMLQRAWCYWELLCALTTQGVSLELLCSPDDCDEQQATVSAGQAARLLNAAESVRYSGAGCSVEADKKALDKALKSTIGTKQALDRTVREPFLAWALYVAQTCGEGTAVQRVARGVAIMAGASAHADRFRDLARSTLLNVYEHMSSSGSADAGVQDAALDVLCDAADIPGASSLDDRDLAAKVETALKAVQSPPVKAGVASIQVTALRFAAAAIAKRRGKMYKAQVALESILADCSTARGASDPSALDAMFELAKLLYTSATDIAGAEKLLIKELTLRCKAANRSLDDVSSKPGKCRCERHNVWSEEEDVQDVHRHATLVSADAYTPGSYSTLLQCACGSATAVLLGRVLVDRGKAAQKDVQEGLTGAQLLEKAGGKGFPTSEEQQSCGCVTM